MEKSEGEIGIRIKIEKNSLLSKEDPKQEKFKQQTKPQAG